MSQLSISCVFLVKCGRHAAARVPSLSPCRQVLNISKQVLQHERQQASLAALRRARFMVGCEARSSSSSFKRMNLHTSVTRCESETVSCPAFAESISEGDVRWEKAAGDSVNEDEVVCEIETDKTTVTVTAPRAGVLETLYLGDGDKVTPGTPMFTITIGEGGAPAPPPPQPTAAAAPQSTPVAAAPVVTPDDSPPSVPPIPTGPISVTPVSQIKPTPAKPAAAAVVTSGTPLTKIAGTRSESRVKMNRMRQRIASRLKEAQNTCAMLTTFNEVDMTNIKDMRSQYKEAFLKKHDLKLGFMSAFVKACAFALQDQPTVNAVIDDMEIVYRDYIDISVAVATPKGLVVPVIRDVQNMNFADIEQTINSLGERARTGSLAIEDMDGGTFTISNGGVFGSMFGTPIINPPQSAILGMHAIFDRPMAVNGKVEIRPMMYVALTYDHRLIDGREAVIFLKKVKSVVEDPRILLLDL